MVKVVLNMWQKIKPYVISIAIALAVGGLSALVSGNMDIYSEIVKPPLAPPAILFPIVWSVLYVLMGISAALIYTDKSAIPEEKRSALTLYALSLGVNFLWSPIFFRLQAFLFALVWLALLLYLVIATIFAYNKITPLAAYLQLPYAVWAAFALILNASIWYLNVHT